MRDQLVAHEDTRVVAHVGSTAAGEADVTAVGEGRGGGPGRAHARVGRALGRPAASWVAPRERRP
ncbi:hypothetical protein, partial [Clavibacter michiganensis]|uniref:hypothetical protein n=1 Tax=Clavibacter michiganensis TaxID=28447 RepID=UPI00292D8252